MPIGWASGAFLPWWISGAPCYYIAILLWLQGIRGAALTGVLWGSLGTAACVGLNSRVAPLVLAFLFIVPFPKNPWTLGLAFYLGSLSLALTGVV